MLSTCLVEVLSACQKVWTPPKKVKVIARQVLSIDKIDNINSGHSWGGCSSVLEVESWKHGFHSLFCLYYMALCPLSKTLHPPWSEGPVFGSLTSALSHATKELQVVAVVTPKSASELLPSVFPKGKYRFWKWGGFILTWT